MSCLPLTISGWSVNMAEDNRMKARETAVWDGAVARAAADRGGRSEEKPA